MGICHGSSKFNDGKLKQIMAKAKKSQDITIIVKETNEIYPIFNPYQNPILNRRLRELSNSMQSKVKQ